MPTQINPTSSVSQPQFLNSATDSPVSSPSPGPSVLVSHEPRLESNQPPQIPDKASPTASVIDAEDAPAGRLTSSTTDSEAQANKKKTHKKSNRYANQTKAKVHIGACAVGGITLGILAGPIGLVFAAAYINAMCVATYGGSEYVTGDKAKHQKTEPEPQPENTPPRHRPNPNLVPPEEGRRPDEPDSEQGREHVGQPNGTIGSNNFIFAPTNIFAPTIINSPTTTQGSVYFFREDNKDHKSTTEQKTSSTASQPNNSSQGSSAPQVNVIGVSTVNRQQATADKPAPLSDVVEGFFDITDGDTALHVRFDDGVNALVSAPESMINDILTKHSKPSQHHRADGFDQLIDSHIAYSHNTYSDVIRGGKTPVIGENGTHSWQLQEQGSWALKSIESTKEVQHAKPSKHHRADGFDQLIDSHIAHSQNDLGEKKKNDKKTPVIGENATHSWQLQQQGSWELKSVGSVNAKTVQEQGLDRAEPHNEKTSSGSASERLDMDSPKPQTLPITSEHIEDNFVDMQQSPKTVRREAQNSKLLATEDLTVGTSSSQWTRVITENGQSRWVNPKQSSGNDKVLLTAGAVSGLAQNYTQGVRNNVKPLDELRMAHFQRLQKNINNNKATLLSRLLGSGLVVAAQPVNEARLIRAKI
ncbi:hypothetical protein [Vibrio cholerae]|uniref:hypothetical protein n=1 Tax=Vibrio cholerae TaxID=666 RepID=UPI002AB4B85F|nr:hypothetical protein [Vibrio cholerae]MDY7588304.1 hypothetical protein [Vibrio cholerae]